MDNKLQELVEKLCPNGVEYKTLDKVCSISTGSQLNKSKLLDDAEYPVINGGINPSGYWHEYNTEKDTITISQGGASAGYVNYMEKPFWAGAHCYVVKLEDDNVSYQYLYQFIKSIEKKLQKRQQGAGIPSVSRKDIYENRIPVPPIDIQNEIVERLNCFTEYLKLLNDELTSREKQLEYVMKNMLKKDKFTDFDTLGNICNIEKGKTPIQKNKPGIYPLVATTEHLQTSDSYQFDCDAVCLPLISSRGHGVASISRIYYQSGKFALGNILCALIPKNNNIKAEFLRHYLFFFKDQLLVPLMRGGANVALTVDSLKGVVVPIPTIAEQENIIDKINSISSLIDKNNGLPAEIERRQKQYEYYRDKLLSFKEVEVYE